MNYFQKYFKCDCGGINSSRDKKCSVYLRSVGVDHKVRQNNMSSEVFNFLEQDYHRKNTAVMEFDHRKDPVPSK